MFNKLYKEFFSWSDCLASFLPGSIGVKLRSLWYRKRFKCDQKISTDILCSFVEMKNISFGSEVSIGKSAFFSAEGGSIHIGSRVAFNSGVHINASVGGKIRLGNDILVGPNVVMRTANHRFDNSKKPIKQQGHTIGDIIVENNVWLAANVIVLSGVRIGEGSVIGAGSVVTKDVPPMSVAIGIPAKVVRSRNE